ncbi:hypothetical protein [Amycolatopsis sp. DSM 110486]|uniref:hypothetical protein n=1 Tax=Amycolatopsis sp. DSM 110486 TaxID=2865832 RepID=UPI001C699D7C|nr:hypothetical protein [Amycolatopsis sp. DSM 110486]QYN16847.1 hypothetical protein K1T34_28795 [Amycolatopsis sp. DSM 110486]
MAKSQIPGFKTGGGALRKVLGACVALALLALIVHYPADAASWAKGAAGTAGGAIDGLVTFFRNLGN